MIVATLDPMPDPPTVEGDDPAMPNPTYNWYGHHDLVTRRKALGLTGQDMAALVGRRSQSTYSAVERGDRPVSDQLLDQVREIETWAARHHDLVLTKARRFIADHPDETVPLTRLSEAQFHKRYPSAATEYAPMPLSIHETVVGRVAAQLEHEGYRVSVQGPKR